MTLNRLKQTFIVTKIMQISVSMGARDTVLLLGLLVGYILSILAF